MGSHLVECPTTVWPTQHLLYLALTCLATEEARPMFHPCMVTFQSPLLFLTKSHHQGSGLKTELWMLASTHLLPKSVNLNI